MRVAFTTLGCRLNQFETEGMRQRVLESGVAGRVVGWDEEADVYVINSCTVTARAEQKCRQLARAARRRRPGSKVMVVGCYGQLHGEELLERLEADAVLGNEEKRRLDDYLPRLLASDDPFAEVGEYRRGTTMASEWIDDYGEQSRATLKIQEGCDLRCAFCAVWRARGPSRSREPREVVEQAQRLARAGYGEIVLAGVQLGHFGRDLDPPVSLAGLLDMLLELVDERVRFRLSSIDPSAVSNELIRRLVEEPRLCRYLHLPLQSGSDAVLTRMRRAYDVAAYESLVRTATEADPEFGVGCDLIVGFPGETEEEFSETLGLLERLPIRFYHVFRYSDRPRTAAERLPGKVPGRIIQERSERLRALGERKLEAFQRRLVGRAIEGVVESTTDGDGRHEVMLDNYAVVWVPLDASNERRRVRVRVTARRSDGRLLGRLEEDATLGGETTA